MHFNDCRAPRALQLVLFPSKPSMFSEVKLSGTLSVEEKQSSLFPIGPVIRCSVIPLNLKREQTAGKINCLILADTQICYSFKVHGLVMCESNV